MASWYVRKTGSDNNGGSSASTTPDQNGTDGVSTGTTTFDAASAAFAVGDVGKGINVAGAIFRVVTRNSATQIIVDRNLPNASGQTWKLGGAVATIGKILQTTAAILQNGDKVWVGGGTYREVLILTLTSPTAEVQVNGDCDGKNTGDAGEVTLTAFTTDDKTAPSGNTTLDLNGKQFLTFQNFTIIGGTASAACAKDATALSHDNTFRECTFIGKGGTDVIELDSTAGSALNALFDRCRFLVHGNMIALDLVVARHTADYALNVTVRNCLFISWSDGIKIRSSGAGTGKPGGVAVDYCTFCCNAGVRVNDANISTTFVVVCTGSLFVGNIGLTATTLGQITESYCNFNTSTPRTNVTAGTGSQTGYAPLYHFGQEIAAGMTLRPFMTPTAGSPTLGFSSAASPPTVDLHNALRPAGGASALPAAGALERGNSFAKETGTVHTGSNAISITGPGYQDFLVPVDAVSTTLKLFLRWDATYAGTKPQIKVLGGTECGVTDATDTATGSSGAWEERSLTFTPTAKGIVTIRVQSNDTNGGGKCFADSFSVV